MHFTDDSLLPENQAPLIITAVPYGQMWMPEDCARCFQLNGLPAMCLSQGDAERTVRRPQ